METHTRKDEQGLFRLQGEKSDLEAIFYGLEPLIAACAVIWTPVAIVLNPIKVVGSPWIPAGFLAYLLGRFCYHLNRYDFPLADEYFTGVVRRVLSGTIHLIAVVTFKYLSLSVPHVSGRILILPFCSWITCICIFVVMGQPLGNWSHCWALMAGAWHDWYIGYASKPKGLFKLIHALNFAHLVLWSTITLALFVINLVLKNLVGKLLPILHEVQTRLSDLFPFRVVTGLSAPEMPDEIYSRDRIYEALSAKGEFRLLKLEKWRPFQPVQVTLFNTTLDEAPAYEAISYCWGDADKTHRILVNGQVMLVPEATYDVLRGRSTSKKTRHIWIDYICIDQLDDDEKSKQVQMMKDIYEKAERVVIWLDESPLIGFLAVSILQEILVQVKTYKLSGQQIVSNCQWERFGLRWRCMQRFLCRPWFTRAWVVQEVAVAKSVDVVCGGLYIDFELLREAASLVTLDPSMGTLFRSGPQGKRCIYALGNLEAMGRLGKSFKRMHDYQRLQLHFMFNPPDSTMDYELELQALQELKTEVQDLDLELLLLQSHSFQATDPRDKLFSLFGLSLDYPSIHCLNDGIDVATIYRKYCEPPVTVDLAPNYRRSTLELYTDVGRHFLRQHNAFAVFSKAGIGSPRSIDGLPSWAPDWTQRIPNCPLNLPVTPLEYQYRAGGNTKLSITFGEDNSTDVCYITSVRVSSIQATGEVLQLEDKDDEMFSKNGKYLGTPQQLDIYEWHKQALSLASEHTTFSIDTNNSEAVTAADMLSPTAMGKALLLQTFWKTLCGEKSPIGTRAPDTFAQDYLDWTSLLAFVNSDHDSTLGSHSRTCNISKADSEQAPNLVTPSYDFFKRQHALSAWGSSLAAVAAGRQFFVTESGHMGMAPPGTKIGDEVFVFAGSKVPVVLRRLEGERFEDFKESKRTGQMASKQYAAEETFEGSKSEALMSRLAKQGQLWQLVGECYLHGFMKGEAFERDDVLLKEISLV